MLIIIHALIAGSKWEGHWRAGQEESQGGASALQSTEAQCSQESSHGHQGHGQDSSVLVTESQNVVRF